MELTGGGRPLGGLSYFWFTPDQTLVTKTDAEHMIVRPVRPRTRHTTHSARDSSDEYPQFTSLEMHVSPHTPAWAPHFTERETKRLITKGVFQA